MKVTNYNPNILTWAAARADKDMSQLQNYFPKIEGWLDQSDAPTHQHFGRVPARQAVINHNKNLINLLISELCLVIKR